MEIQEILIIKNAHESYGISTDDINQISRVPSLMPLPLRPSSVRGLCSVGGNVVSMVDLNLLLGVGEVDLEASASRIISLNGKMSSNTLLVSDVYNTVEIDQNNIDYIDDGNDSVVAIYKYNDLLVQVCSLDKLFTKINKVQIQAKEIHSGKQKEEVEAEEDSSRFLIFSMSEEKYALEIDYLQEIILAEGPFTEIAGSDETVLGLITLRDELLMVIDLRIYYGFKPKSSEANRILIVSYEGKKIGLCIDSIIDINNFYKKDIEYMSENFDKSKVAGVIHAKDSLISFFDHHVIQNILKENESFIENTNNNSEDIKENIEELQSTKEVIIFKLSSKEYAFNVDIVDEIIDMVPSTSIAFTDESLDGIINIRGQIVSIVSLFKKLKVQTTINEDSKIIVCDINENKIGFVVDSVSDILSIKEEDIVVDEENYFDSVLHLDDGKRLVLSLDMKKVIAKKVIDHV